MPYAISWLVEKQVVYTRTYGFVTGEELRNQNKEIQVYAQQTEQLVHIITDATDTTGTDMSIRDLQKTQFLSIGNLGWALYISPSKMNRFFASIITQLSNKRGRQFATLEEGLTFLQQIDESLPQFSAPDKSNAA